MNISQFNHLETSGKLLIDLGFQPVSNRFQAVEVLTEAPKFPLQLHLCMDTGLIHLGKSFPIEEIKPCYDWLTCYEPEEHLDELVKRIITLPNVNKESIIGAYSFKDDSTLRRLENIGYHNTWRVDPQLDLGITDDCANVETFQSVSTSAKLPQIRQRCGIADVLIVRHVIEHAYDLPEFIRFIKGLVKPGGYIVWELPDCERALTLGDFTTIWEEHIFYFTSGTFKQLMYSSGFEIIHFESIPYVLENSIIAIVREAALETIDCNIKIVKKEVSRAIGFAKSLVQRRLVIRKKLESIRRERGPIAVFGAGHLTVAFISIMEVTDLISCVLDDNPNKKGLRMPIGALEIKGSGELYTGNIGTCLLGLNPQNQPKVIASHQQFIERGGVFASIFPGSELDIERIL